MNSLTCINQCYRLINAVTIVLLVSYSDGYLKLQSITFCVQNVCNKQVQNESIFQTVFLTSSESLWYIYNKGLYSDYFRLVRVGTAAELPGTCMIRLRHKQREKWLRLQCSSAKRTQLYLLTARASKVTVQL